VLKLAILHAALVEQIKETHLLSNLDIIFADISPQMLQQQSSVLMPEIVVLDLKLLGEQPLLYIQELKQVIPNAIIIVVYAFSKWSLVQEIAKMGIRIIKEPINLRLLQTSVFGLITQEIAATKNNPNHDFKAPEKRYSLRQLSQLQQIKSAVECECPNHLADLVIALSAFESYSRDCHNRNPQDAEIHTMLHERTAQARQIMEQALAQLCQYEQIILDDTP
jgi:DNA-binding NtrC family response regulator